MLSLDILFILVLPYTSVLLGTIQKVFQQQEVSAQGHVKNSSLNFQKLGKLVHEKDP